MLKKGFTLLETIVAIGILSLAMTGVFSLASLAIRSASVSSNQTIAFFLASEAVEYIRNIRDSNVFAGSDWLTGLGMCRVGINANGCFIDVTVVPPNDINDCGAVCPKIEFNRVSNLYNYASDPNNEETIFVRQILISDVAPGVEVKVTVVMSWQQRTLTRTFTLEEYLFNR